MNTMSNADLAENIACTMEILDESLYNGTTVTINLNNLNPFSKKEFNPFYQVRFIKKIYRLHIPTTAEIADNEMILASAPIEAEVIFQVRLKGYKVFRVYRKVDTCKWKKTVEEEEYLDE